MDSSEYEAKLSGVDMLRSISWVRPLVVAYAREHPIKAAKYFAGTAVAGIVADELREGEKYELATLVEQVVTDDTADNNVRGNPLYVGVKRRGSHEDLSRFVV